MPGTCLSASEACLQDGRAICPHWQSQNRWLSGGALESLASLGQLRPNSPGTPSSLRLGPTLWRLLPELRHLSGFLQLPVLAPSSLDGLQGKISLTKTLPQILASMPDSWSQVHSGGANVTHPPTRQAPLPSLALPLPHDDCCSLTQKALLFPYDSA